MEVDLKKMQVESVKQIEDLNQFKLKKMEVFEQLDFKCVVRSELLKKFEFVESEMKEQCIQLKVVEEQMCQMEIFVNRFDVEFENILCKLMDDYEFGYELVKE